MARPATKAPPRTGRAPQPQTPRDLEIQVDQLKANLNHQDRWNGELEKRHRAIDDVLKGQELILGAMRRLMRSEGTTATLPPIDARYSASQRYPDLDDDCPF